jgi:hypothetical protein
MYPARLDVFLDELFAEVDFALDLYLATATAAAFSAISAFSKLSSLAFSSAILIESRTALALAASFALLLHPATIAANANPNKIRFMLFFLSKH